MGRFCPICGRSEAELIDGLCAECYKSRHAIVELPGEVEIKLCKGCLSVSDRGRWIGVKGDYKLIIRGAALMALDRCMKRRGIVEAMDVEVQDLPLFSGKPAKVPIRVRTFGTSHPSIAHYVEEAGLTLRTSFSTCPKCIAAATKRERAIIQVRAHGRKLTVDEVEAVWSIVNDSLKRLHERDGEAVIVGKEQNGYINIKLHSIKVARSLALSIHRELVSKLRETTKTIGQRRGEPIVKHTILLLLPQFSAGDIVEHEDELIYVLCLGRGSARGIKLIDWTEATIPSASIFKKVKLVKKAHELIKSMVLSVKSSGIQLLTYQGYEVVEIPPPPRPHRVSEGDEVHVADIGGRLYVIPKT